MGGESFRMHLRPPLWPPLVLAGWETSHTPTSRYPTVGVEEQTTSFRDPLVSAT